MSDLHKNIRARRQELKMTQTELAMALGYADKSMIAKIEKGLVDLSESKIKECARILKTTVYALMGLETEIDVAFGNLRIKNTEDFLPIEEQRVPILGNIACGTPNSADENFEGYAVSGTGIPADFALRCKGDSMINARIYDGDLVFIRKQDTVNNGEIAAVLVEEEATLKRVYTDERTITLVAENSSFPPILIDRKKDSQMVFKILGKAVAFQSNLD